MHAAAQPAPFQREKLVRFHHCDPAGIVFYPQYFVMFHELVEDWFTQALGVDYSQMTTSGRLGTPTVSVRGEFTAPSTQGETLRLTLGVRAVGRSSIQLALRAGVDGQTRAEIDQTLVLFSLDTRRAVAVSDDLRRNMLRFAIPAEASA